MRRRTPSEIKAYGDGYAEAYKQFCHLLEKNDKDKAIRKMELFAKAVEITVETAMDEPNSSEKPNNWEAQKWAKENCKGCKYNEYPYDESTCFVRVCINGNKYEPKDEPQTDCAWK